VDAEFPADNTALFLDPDGPAQVTSEVRSWRRPREINPKSALFVGGSCDSDVVQGALGDCWFLAALCVVATRHDLMQQLFVSCHPEHGLW
jgi:calpain